MSDPRERVASLLVSRYFSTSGNERAGLLQMLGELGMRYSAFRLHVTQLLMRGLIDKEEACQAASVHYLGELGRVSSEVAVHLVYPFTMLLLQPHLKPVVVYHVLVALEKIRKDRVEIHGYLKRGIADVAYLEVAKLASRDPLDRRDGTWKLGKLGRVWFPAIIDLVPSLLDRLVDDDETVNSIAFSAVIALLEREEIMFGFILDYLASNNVHVKVRIYDVIEARARTSRVFTGRIVDRVVADLSNLNRQVYLRVHKVLKFFEKLDPLLFTRRIDLLVKNLGSESRHAYHWAVQHFTSNFLPHLRQEACLGLDIFLDKVLELLAMIHREASGNLMQTRVVLVMLAHEVKEALLSARAGLVAESLQVGFLESLNQIQKSRLASETEVSAAYEKFHTVLQNARQLVCSHVIAW